MIERPEAFQTIRRTARKQYNCCECGKVIEIGTKYQNSSGIWDGEPAAFKQCLDCADIMDSAAKEAYSYDEGPAFRGLREFFENEMSTKCHGVMFVLERARELQCEPKALARLLGIDLAK